MKFQHFFKIFKHLFLSFSLIVSLFFLSTIAYAKDPLTLGIFPRFNPDQTRSMFMPLTKHLQAQLQRSVKLVTSKDYESFMWLLKSKKFDIVHFNQYHYMKAHKQDAYEVILRNEEFGKSTMSGALFVRPDSHISSIDQLKGKKIMFGGGPSAMISSIVPRHLLKQAGIHDDDYQTIYARNPPNAVIATFSGEAEAVGAGTVLLQLEMTKQFLSPEQLTLLVQSPPLAHLPWAVTGSMDSQLKKDIQSVLANLAKSKQGKKILQQANLTGLVPTLDTAYNPHRAIVLDLLGEVY